MDSNNQQLKDDDEWVMDVISNGTRWLMKVTDKLESQQSPYQFMQLVNTLDYGKVLLLDGKVQSASSDERCYHELLVQPAMLHHPNPKSVFIMGGGEGATAREVLKHKSVELCVMVDIDEVVCNFCKQHLTENQVAFADPRLKLVFDDAGGQLEKWPHKFDVIIGDLADPLEAGPCFQLYTKEFYESVVKPQLNPGGIFVTQATAATIPRCSTFTAVLNTLKQVFPRVLPYTHHVPSFCEEWAWVVCFTDDNVDTLTPEEIESKVEKFTSEEMHFLDGETWRRVTSLDKYIRKAIVEEVSIYTKNNPAFFFGQGSVVDRIS